MLKIKMKSKEEQPEDKEQESQCLASTIACRNAADEPLQPENMRKIQGHCTLFFGSETSTPSTRVLLIKKYSTNCQACEAS